MILNIIIFYLIGYIITYRIGSKVDRECYILNWGNDDKYDWNDVKDNALFSLLSWLFVIWYVYMLFFHFKKSKPPRWL